MNAGEPCATGLKFLTMKSLMMRHAFYNDIIIKRAQKQNFHLYKSLKSAHNKCISRFEQTCFTILQQNIN